ncbi:hypothetical protein [Streptomyces sp. IB2014 016-6]|uniref:hypothetical protein n=1 Tax=Streptomyces sp. IB2014 016-6 TaxID=2517818 RepID=UPI0011C725F4|nr:hypothetical protein [Streptomyces sp. IB2014 016-6]TXL83882.1 hypothetical protein EW053_36130 [Streptomyces sp. IB2014 016-6]
MTGKDPKSSEADEVTQHQGLTHEVNSRALPLLSDDQALLNPRKAPAPPGERKATVTSVSHADAFLFPREAPSIPPERHESHFSDASDDEGASKANSVGEAARALTNWFKGGKSASATKASAPPSTTRPGIRENPNRAKRGAPR